VKNVSLMIKLSMIVMIALSLVRGGDVAPVEDASVDAASNSTANQTMLQIDEVRFKIPFEKFTDNMDVQEYRNHMAK
jgi:hypothetical protein